MTTKSKRQTTTEMDVMTEAKAPKVKENANSPATAKKTDSRTAGGKRAPAGNGRNGGKQKNHPDNPKTRLAGKIKTMTSEIKYTSDFMNRFLTNNEQRILNVFERLSAIYRMARLEEDSYRKIRGWHEEVNLHIAIEQLNALESQRLETSGSESMGELQINIPNAYKISFEISHPVTNSVIDVIKAVDAELNEIEKVFMSGLIDDLQYEAASRQAVSIMTGIVDRIFKVTSPGKRDGGSFNTSLYMSFLRNPDFDLIAITDIPQEFREHFAKSAA